MICCSCALAALPQPATLFSYLTYFSVKSKDRKEREGGGGGVLRVEMNGQNTAHHSLDGLGLLLLWKSELLPILTEMYRFRCDSANVCIWLLRLTIRKASQYLHLLYLQLGVELTSTFGSTEKVAQRTRRRNDFCRRRSRNGRRRSGNVIAFVELLQSAPKGCVLLFKSVQLRLRQVVVGRSERGGVPGIGAIAIR